jgi:hypothetical protein
MWVAAMAFAVVGLVLALNIGNSADRLARISRALPWWFRWPIRSDHPTTNRALGVAYLIFATLFALAAVSSR